MTKYHRHLHRKKQNAIEALGQSKTQFIDMLTYGAAVVEPVLVVPQIFRIFRDGHADGVSLATWIGFQIMTTIWLWYGIVHRQKAIIVSSCLFWVTQFGVILGGFLYGAKW